MHIILDSADNSHSLVLGILSVLLISHMSDAK